MIVAVIGANGQLGRDVVEAFRAVGDQVVELTHGSAEVRDRSAVAGVLGAARPNVVVNTAAFHHVEKCQDDPATAFAVNCIGAKNVADACAQLDAAMVHISTDYVFDGLRRQPYREQHLPNPLNVYGISKLAGEQMVRISAPRHFILRVSGIYGHAPCRAKGANFVQLMLRLAKERKEVRVVDDETLAPTATADIARQMVRLVATSAYGLYHCAAHGQCTWYEFARKIFELAGVRTPLVIADPTEFPAKTPRPKYSVLANEHLGESNLDVMRDWDVGLADFLRSYLATQS